MIVNPCILMRVMPEGSLFPVLQESAECPTPTFIVWPSNVGPMSKEEWIEKYKVINLTPSEIEFRFVDLGPLEV